MHRNLIINTRLPLLAAILLGGLLAGCGGGGDGGGSSATTSGTRPGAVPVKIDPTSGPAGTTIKWSISGCDSGDEKSATLYAASLSDYLSSGNSKSIAKSARGKSDTGTLKVPAGAASGDYTLAVACSSTTPKGGGTFVIGVKSGETGFTVTG